MLIRQSVLLEQIVKKIDELEGTVRVLRDTQLSKTESRLAVSEEKVNRLEKIVYGSLAVILINLVSMILLWIQQKH